MRRLVFAAVLAVLARQSAAEDSTKAGCDSIIAAAKVDEVPVGIFLSAQEISGAAPDAQMRRIVINVANYLVAPRPFKLNVFTGPSLVRGLRTIGADTARVLRPVTLTGIYRVTVQGGDSVPEVSVIRRSLVEGFDSAAVTAIRGASAVAGVFAASTGEPLTLDLTFASDSVPNALRLFSGDFPRMLVKDASPRPDSPAPSYRSDSTAAGVPVTVMLRFVVAADGVMEPATLELVRHAPLSFIRAAYDALTHERFVPATVNGCPVAQQVDYPFVFLPPEDGSQGLTRRR